MSMRRVFADSFYFFAVLNVRDSAHQKAVEFSQSHDMVMVTTAWVLTELADGLCRSSQRQAFGKLINTLAEDADTTIVPPSESLFATGVELYDARPDKNWSLTDCISFVVMQEEGLIEALTADHHFEQAGFTILFK